MELRAWREGEGLTQAALAAELSIHPQYLSDIERGVRAPGSRLSIRILKRTGGLVTPNDLLSATVRAERRAA